MNGGADNIVIPLIISIISVAIALFALGWNVYRDVILKPRLKVKFSVGVIVHPIQGASPEKLDVTATNFGPGKISLRGLRLKNKKFLRTAKYAFLMHAYTDQFSAQFPCDLDVGDMKTFLLHFSERCFLKDPYTHIGIIDSFGRIQWTSRKQFRKVKKTYDMRFKNSEQS